MNASDAAKAAAQKRSTSTSSKAAGTFYIMILKQQAFQDT